MSIVRTQILLGSWVGISMFASVSNGSLMPLPGTVLASTQSSNTIFQFDGLTGTLIGTLDVITGGQSLGSLAGIDVYNNQIVVSGGNSVVGGGTGIVNMVSGEIQFLTTTYAPQYIDHLDSGNFIIGGAGRFRGLRNELFRPVGSIQLQFAAGTYFLEEFRGVAATSTGFATTYQPYFDEIQLWNLQGQYQGRRQFANDAFGLENMLEYDATTNAFWFGETNLATSRIKRYGPSSPNAEWSINVPGVLNDLAYIPVPAPGAAAICAVGTLMGTIRRRRY